MSDRHRADGAKREEGTATAPFAREGERGRTATWGSWRCLENPRWCWWCAQGILMVLSNPGVMLVVLRPGDLVVRHRGRVGYTEGSAARPRVVVSFGCGVESAPPVIPVSNRHRHRRVGHRWKRPDGVEGSHLWPWSAVRPQALSSVGRENVSPQPGRAVPPPEWGIMLLTWDVTSIPIRASRGASAHGHDARSSS